MIAICPPVFCVCGYEADNTGVTPSEIQRRLFFLQKKGISPIAFHAHTSFSEPVPIPAAVSPWLSRMLVHDEAPLETRPAAPAEEGGAHSATIAGGWLAYPSLCHWHTMEQSLNYFSLALSSVQQTNPSWDAPVPPFPNLCGCSLCSPCWLCSASRRAKRGSPTPR